MGPQPIQNSTSAILHACWLVRYYKRGGRSGVGKLRRAQAIQRLGLVMREAFNTTDDFEPVLAALVDGLHPHDEPPF